MYDMLLAIWNQDFDQLVALHSVGLLISCLVVILFLESSFVFLPLPGDSLMLLAGGLVGVGVLGPEVTLLYLPCAAGMGSLLAYLQGRVLQGTVLMDHLQRIVPQQRLFQATQLLSRYGFLAMFSSRFVPVIRVLTPMLMGMGKLPPLRMVVASFASAFLWTQLLSLLGRGMMSIPLFIRHQELITRLLLISALLLFVCAVAALGMRFAHSSPQRHPPRNS
jgi:membrane protein DedA with SNARE-associated domain